MSILYDTTKRFLDCVVSLCGLILLIPCFLLIALAIRRNSSGPILYAGPRTGHKGKIFKILKFRTMYEVPESYSGPKVTAHNDPRITKIGHWLRDTKLNELPQLWNVFVGEMSLVGPRPEDPDIVETWPKEVREEILSVKPGITSPASVEYRNEEMLICYEKILSTYLKDFSPDKIRMDELYVRHRSFWLDLDTLFWTFLLLLPKIGSHTPPEEFLFVGPFTRLVRRYMNWFAIDLLISFAAIGFAGVAWRVAGPIDVGWTRSLAVAFGFSLLFSLSGAILGVNRIAWSKASFADGFDLLPAWFLATGIVTIANQAIRIFPTPMVLVASGFALSGFVIVRYSSRLLNAFTSRCRYAFSRGRNGRERVLIIGAGVLAQHAVWLLSHPLNALKYWVVGFVDDDLFKQGMRIYGVEVIGMVNDIPRLVSDNDVGVIILTANNSKGLSESRPVIDLCNKTKAKLLVLPDFFTVFNTLPGVMTQIPITASGKARENEMDCLRCMTKFAPTLAEAPGSPNEKNIDDWLN